MKTVGRNETARRNRRKGELRGFNRCIEAAKGLKDFYKKMYEKSKHQNDDDKTICLGRVFAAEEMLNTLVEIKNKP